MGKHLGKIGSHARISSALAAYEDRFASNGGLVKPRQSHEGMRSSESEEFCAVVVAGSSNQSSGLDAPLSFYRVHPDKVQGNVFQSG